MPSQGLRLDISARELSWHQTTGAAHIPRTACSEKLLYSINRDLENLRKKLITRSLAKSPLTLDLGIDGSERRVLSNSNEARLLRQLPSRLKGIEVVALARCPIK